VNSWVWPAITVMGFGRTAMWSRSPVVTETDAMPVTEPFAAETKPLPSKVWAVNCPEASINPTSAFQAIPTPGRTLLNAS
jgi:hypothetical protein